MTSIKVMLAAASLALALPAVAAEAADAAAPTEKQPRVVCFAEKATGSHLRKRICMTETEREARRRADQQEMSKLRRSTGAGGVARGRD